MDSRIYLSVLAAAALTSVLSIGCEPAAVSEPQARRIPVEGTEATEAMNMQTIVEQQLPFHSEFDFDFRQIPVPAGHCTGTPPAGEYLWLTEFWGSGTATHLGNAKLEGTLCVFGELTDSSADPPGNGTPFGYHGDFALVAANGDRLRATFHLTGFTGEPGTPSFVITEYVRFVDGGTGRFQFAEGEATGYLSEANRTYTCDGWIRYGRKDR
jgi:hypothetical protein